MCGSNSKVEIPGNILNQIKNKEASVVSINENIGAFNPSGNIIVSELKSDGTCRRLPDISILKPGNPINKNIFVTGKKNIRLYANSKCTIRANEEAYADVKKPEPDLFSPNISPADIPDPNNVFTFVPYKSHQNAQYYKVNDTKINTPRIPQFYIKKSSDTYDNYINKQFVEYEDRLPSVCREIPTTNQTDFVNRLDYHFIPKETDKNTGRETGIDRFPDENNTISNAPGVMYQPITIYTDSNCKNIYTSSIRNSGDKLKNGSNTPPGPNGQYRYTPIPYTKIKNYGTVVAEKTNSLYYELKNEPGLLD